MKLKNLPKGFVDLTGAYLVKAVPVHKVLLTPEEVNNYRNELSEKLVEEVNTKVATALRKELKKLSRDRAC
jgi:hypothetical protein